MTSAACSGPSVAVFPPLDPSGDNPYIAQLHEALERAGVRMVPAERLSPRWVRDARGRVDVVHLHWLEFVVPVSRRSPTDALRSHLRVLRFVRALRRLRAAGIRTVWTVHNLRPHEPRYPRLERFLVRHTAARADALVFHSATAADRFAQELNRSIHAWIAPHPHYRDSYEDDPRPPAELRAAYGLDQSSFVYLIFGQLRPYKKVVEAIRGFSALPDADAKLVIAGAPLDAGVTEEIQREAGNDPRVVTILRRLKPEEIGSVFGLADAAVLNYEEVFSSGALLLALSYGVPVVAPARGAVAEIAGSPAIEAFGVGGLTAALAAVRNGDPGDRRRAALDAVASLTPDRQAATVLEAYRGHGGELVSVPAGGGHH